MKRKIVYFVIVALVCTNIFTLVNISAADKNSVTGNGSLDSARLANSKYLYISSIKNIQLNNNIKINGQLQLLNDEQGTLKLEQLVSRGPKLIVRNTETGCGACIENELKKIKKFADIIGDSNIIVITTHSNLRKLSVFKQTNKVTFPIFIAADLGVPFEKESDKPFIFLLASDMRVHNFFIPEVTEPELSQAYYSSIYKRYFWVAGRSKFEILPSL
ncbi:hypothetical protein ACFOTA_08255 [Chitinophaga sp. GCM10012297]|uniref:Uncharacterized protein n=1 Tax=Chitinophaga chungangae TaxID=2821488 RepID=A0ABS3YBY8_9BACT|nr:hypothetical protein [Chitinophaga chungangae]MBO9152195.1 hypothetical protein [Chitinophaga chungangae]